MILRPLECASFRSLRRAESLPAKHTRPNGPTSELGPLVASLAEPKKPVLVEAEDHFFAGALTELERQIAGLS
jgi:hypothetical protein